MSKKLLVLIAQAHGSNTPGKRSPDGRLLEYKGSREICAKIQSKLSDLGIKSIIINPEEKEVGLTTQANRANSYYNSYKGAYNVVLISPHVNASANSGWHTGRGWSGGVCKNASGNSKKLAQLLYAECEKLNLKGNRWVPANKYWEADYTILKKTKMPAVLTENLFQDNKQDVEYLLSDKGKNDIVQLHVNAILEYGRGLN